MLVALPALAEGSRAPSEMVPVPGGLPALAQALGIEVPDRGRCVAELVRLVYPKSGQDRDRRNPLVPSLIAHLRAASAQSSTDLVPMPLPATVWSRVLGRPVTAATLFSDVMSDAAAAHLAHGLSALDDETLQFLAARPALVAWLYEHASSVVAAFAAHVRVRANRVVPPGGEAAVPLWETLLSARVTEPDAFLTALFATNRGRVAYLYDLTGYLDSSRAAFVLGLWIADPGVRVDRFSALARFAASAFPEWNVKEFPFTRPAYDLSLLFSRLRVAANGAPAFPSSQSFWNLALKSHEVQTGDVGRQKRFDGPPIDAAWLAEALLSNAGTRSGRLDQFAFGQRAFVAVDPGTLPDVLATVAAFPQTTMLLLTLERIGVSQPSVYAALVRHARELSKVPAMPGPVAQAQFQGAIAIIDRLVRVRTIDRVRAEALLVRLADVPLDVDRGYMGAMAGWLRTLRTALGGSGTLEGAILQGMAGASAMLPPRDVTWEGEHHVFDLVRYEADRLRRVRERTADASIDEVLSEINGPGRTVRLDRLDELLGQSLLSFVYAAEWGPYRSPARLKDVVKRHDFGFRLMSREHRMRAAWSLPRLVSVPGVPWHIEGAALGLDVALAPLSMRRITMDSAAAAPAISSNDRDTFVKSLALLNPFTLQDDTGDAIVEAVQRGRRRVELLASGGGDLGGIIRDTAMDGWRARALAWAVANESDRLSDWFSLTDLVNLGGGHHLDLNALGMSAITSEGCLCVQIVPTGRWSSLVGRPQLGLIATAVADLNLHIVMALRELGLPTALAKSVLAAAVQEFVDEVRPLNADDWLGFVRAAQRVSAERIQDYVAATTFAGPLTPAPLTGGGR